jgi:hypothetical protein
MYVKYVQQLHILNFCKSVFHHTSYQRGSILAVDFFFGGGGGADYKEAKETTELGKK